MAKQIADTSATTKTLNEISKEYLGFEELMNSIEGDIGSEDQERISGFLNELDSDRDKKFDAYCAVIRGEENKSKAARDEADRLSKLARVRENRVKRLKWLLLTFLQTHGLDKVETNFNVIRRAANGSAPVVLNEHFTRHPEELEERFRTVTFKPNLTEIAQALRDGETLDFASFAEKGENLKIG